MNVRLLAKSSFNKIDIYINVCAFESMMVRMHLCCLKIQSKINFLIKNIPFRIDLACCKFIFLNFLVKILTKLELYDIL